MNIVAPAIFHRQTMDEIAAGFEICLSAVYAAFSYYYDHRGDVLRRTGGVIQPELTL
jgi:hypothetical protein